MKGTHPERVLDPETGADMETQRQRDRGTQVQRKRTNGKQAMA